MTALCEMSPPRTRARAGRFALVAAGVALLHGIALWSFESLAPTDERPLPPAPLAVRSVESLPPPPVPAAADADADAPALRLPPPPAATVRERRADVRTSAPPRTSAPVVAPVQPGPAALARPATTPDALPPASAELPVYATRLAAPARLHYRLTRGDTAGDAVLDWQPDAERQRYELHLTGQAGGAPLLDWASRGALDASGIAPERFAIRRRGRDSMAANFQRDAGKITWSGPTHEVPLTAGAQDRLSWLVQLPAVLEAAPGRYGAGTHIDLMIIGARGGADVWVFEVQGIDRVDDIPAVKLVRHARRAYDVQVQAWLDPAQAHLPVRVLLTQGEGGPAFELRWRPPPAGEGSTGP